MKIFIDNGHGRKTAGKRSPDGQFLEYYYNRIVARRVTAKLQALGLDAELLVPEEDDISGGEVSQGECLVPGSREGECDLCQHPFQRLREWFGVDFPIGLVHLYINWQYCCGQVS